MGTESNPVSRDRAGEPGVVCPMCPAQRGFTANQEGLAAHEAGTLWDMSHQLLCQHQAHPWSRALLASQGFGGSITWVAHLCSYFHIVPQFFWLLEARYFSTWTVAVCTPKAFISGQQGDIQYFFLWQQGHIQYFFLWWQPGSVHTLLSRPKGEVVS